MRHPLLPSSISHVQASLKLFIPHGKTISTLISFPNPLLLSVVRAVCTSLSAGRRQEKSIISCGIQMIF